MRPAALIFFSIALLSCQANPGYVVKSEAENYDRQIVKEMVSEYLSMIDQKDYPELPLEIEMCSDAKTMGCVYKITHKTKNCTFESFAEVVCVDAGCAYMFTPYKKYMVCAQKP